jgi:RNA polymerase-binding transcription factor DksA
MQDGSVFADAGNQPVAASVAQDGAKGGIAGADRVQTAFVSLAVARLERDHVALLAALCELEQAQQVSSARHAAVMQQAITAVLREELRQTQRALERAADGTLGYCERCGAPLAVAILLAQPATTHCPACTAAVERGNQVH